MSGVDWPERTFAALRSEGVRLVAYVPDAGHKRLIELCQAERDVRSVVLTSEEEGIGLAAGAWLGGMRSVLLMQSSGVGNCINVLGMVRECRLPLLMLVTMRGEEGEFNPWQVPMGRATASVLQAMDVRVRRVPDAEEIPGAVQEAARRAYDESSAHAILIAQQVIGIKSFQQQAAQ
jgi:sulfopyruvate decarboxylase alpha subunit